MLPVISQPISTREHDYSIKIQKHSADKSTISNRGIGERPSEFETNGNDNYELQELLVEPLATNIVNVLGVTFSTNIPLEDVCHTEFALEITPIDNLTFPKELYNVTYLNETCKVCLKDLTSSEDKIVFFDDLGDISSEIMKVYAALQSMDVEITRDVKLPQQICIECYNTFSDMTLFKEICQRSKQALDTICDFTTQKLENMIVEKEFAFAGVTACEVEIKEELSEEDVEIVQTVDQSILHVENTPSLSHQKNSPNQNHRQSFICFRCGGNFTSQSSLIHHRNYDYCVDEECPECKLCGEKLSSIDHLDCHIATSHSRMITCTICARPFYSLTKYQHHQQSHNPLICDFCGEGFYLKRNIQLHMKEHIIDAYPCFFCEERFETRKRLGIHTRRYHPNQLYKSPYCPKEYKLHYMMMKHSLSHKPDKPHKCTFCEKQFVLRQHLDNHIRTHTKAKPFLCSFCGKTYRQEIALKDHLSDHDPKLYPRRRGHPKNVAKKSTKIHYCDICSYSTNQHGNLVKHKIVHSGRPARKMEFTCEICDKGLRLEKSLENHVSIHNEVQDYKCTQCKASFTKPHYLRIHVDGVHLKKRPYKCDQCDAGYLMSNDLKRHKLQKHTSERPFECYVCQKSYVGLFQLKIHIKNIHRKDKSFKL